MVASGSRLSKTKIRPILPLQGFGDGYCEMLLAYFEKYSFLCVIVSLEQN